MSLSTASDPTSTVLLKRLIKLHPLTAYFILAYLYAWISWLPLVLSRNGLGVLSFVPSAGWMYALEVLGSLVGPTLAAFLVTHATLGKEGVRQLLRKYIQRPLHLRWYFVILAGTPLLVVIAASIASFFGGSPDLLTQRGLMLFIGYLPFVLISIPGGPLGEEPGWRGIALPRLQRRYGAFPATLILGVLWGFWHLPLFLVRGADGPFSLVGFGAFLLGVFFLSIFLTWIYNSTEGSLLMVIVLHAALNTNSSLIALLTPIFPRLGLTLYIIYGASALLILLFTRGHLSYLQRNI